MGGEGGGKGAGRGERGHRDHISTRVPHTDDALHDKTGIWVPVQAQSKGKLGVNTSVSQVTLIGTVFFAGKKAGAHPPTCHAKPHRRRVGHCFPACPAQESENHLLSPPVADPQPCWHTAHLQPVATQHLPFFQRFACLLVAGSGPSKGMYSRNPGLHRDVHLLQCAMLTNCLHSSSHRVHSHGGLMMWMLWQLLCQWGLTCELIFCDADVFICLQVYLASQRTSTGKERK